MQTSISNMPLYKIPAFPPGIATEIEGASVVIAGQRFGYEKCECDESTLSRQNKSLKLIEQRERLTSRLNSLNEIIQNILELKSGENDLELLKTEKTDLQFKIKKLEEELIRH